MKAYICFGNVYKDADPFCSYVIGYCLADSNNKAKSLGLFMAYEFDELYKGVRVYRCKKLDTQHSLFEDCWCNIHDQSIVEKLVELSLAKYNEDEKGYYFSCNEIIDINNSY